MRLSRIKRLDVGHNETAVQGKQLGAMQSCELIERLFAVFQQVNFNAPSILLRTSTHHKAQLLATRNECDNAVLLCLKPVREFPDRCPGPTRIALDVEQQQILQRRQTVRTRDLFAEALELSYLVTEVRQNFKIMLFQGRRFKLRHGSIHFGSLSGAFSHRS